MIWKYVAHQPREVETSLYEGVISTYHATHTLVPGIMHTCTESRAIGLEFYEGFGHVSLTRFLCSSVTSSNECP